MSVVRHALEVDNVQRLSDSAATRVKSPAAVTPKAPCSPRLSVLLQRAFQQHKAAEEAALSTHRPMHRADCEADLGSKKAKFTVGRHVCTYA